MICLRTSIEGCSVPETRIGCGKQLGTKTFAQSHANIRFRLHQMAALVKRTPAPNCWFPPSTTGHLQINLSPPYTKDMISVLGVSSNMGGCRRGGGSAPSPPPLPPLPPHPKRGLPFRSDDPKTYLNHSVLCPLNRVP